MSGLRHPCLVILSGSRCGADANLKVMRDPSRTNRTEIAMPQQDHFDALIIGSGEGGKFLAWHLARSGHRTAVVERKLIGGSCPNTNCLPSKNEIWSARMVHLVRHANQFG